MLSSMIDSLLARLFATQRRAACAEATLPTCRLDTPVGPVRVHDSGPAAGKPCVVLVPDGPNVIEHCQHLIGLLSPHLRVVCFDMPGFGHSLPRTAYRHSLDQGASAVLGVLDGLGIASATLAFSCANGFYALRAAQVAPGRIDRLVLSQTPSLSAMHAWTARIIPWPLRVPVLGQVIACLCRQKMARSWYRLALPKTTEAQPFQAQASRALADGGCFCLAGVVQGLGREQEASLRGVAVPLTVVWGTLDRSHKTTEPRSLLASVPHGEVLHFQDCGHFPDIEQPERYAALLLERVVGSLARPRGFSLSVRHADNA